MIEEKLDRLIKLEEENNLLLKLILYQGKVENNDSRQLLINILANLLSNNEKL